MISIDTMLAGLNEGEFFLEYCPTISLADYRCTGAEALIRWRRATGVVQPADFIPLAEHTLISGLLTYWVIDTVALEMSGWLGANPDAHIAINIPPEILGRGGILYATRKSGLDKFASQLVLEITERGLADLSGIEALNMAKRVLPGIRLALDDVTFAGNASLAILARANFDIIKLDRSLVAQIRPQCCHPDWLTGVTALVQSSQLRVIAEGVETKQQLTTLRSAGVQEAQGFYFSHPIPAARCIAYHREASPWLAQPAAADRQVPESQAD
jgi:sensor c-di-GMP phosphodiesterase-like protein